MLHIRRYMRFDIYIVHYNTSLSFRLSFHFSTNSNNNKITMHNQLSLHHRVVLILSYFS